MVLDKTVPSYQNDYHQCYVAAYSHPLKYESSVINFVVGTTD